MLLLDALMNGVNWLHLSLAAGMVLEVDALGHLNSQGVQLLVLGDLSALHRDEEWEHLLAVLALLLGNLLDFLNLEIEDIVFGVDVPEPLVEVAY